MPHAPIFAFSIANKSNAAPEDGPVRSCVTYVPSKVPIIIPVFPSINSTCAGAVGKFALAFSWNIFTTFNPAISSYPTYPGINKNTPL